MIISESENFGFIINGTKHFTPKETFKLCKQGAVLVDVREEFMTYFKQFDIENLLLLPLSELITNYQVLSEDIHYIFADATGLRSKEAIEFLSEKGVKNISNLAGGLVEWESDQLPIKINTKEKLSGSCMCQIKSRIK
jgi:rhodanese-related sulfurtransferase